MRLEGSIANTGALVQWFRDNLGLINSAPEIETLALTVDDNGGCYFVPAFAGLFAPHRRTHRLHNKGTLGPRGARGKRLADARGRGCDEFRCVGHDAETARGWRHDAQQPADAVPR